MPDGCGNPLHLVGAFIAGIGARFYRTGIFINITGITIDGKAKLINRGGTQAHIIVIRTVAIGQPISTSVHYDALNG